MAWHEKRLGDLVAMLHHEFGEHHYGRVDLTLKTGQAQRALAHFGDSKLRHFLDWPVTNREDLDGIKIYLADIGWVMLRASGTEHMLRVYAETTRPETTRRILDEVSGFVRQRFEFARHWANSKKGSTGPCLPTFTNSTVPQSIPKLQSITKTSKAIAGLFPGPVALISC